MRLIIHLTMSLLTALQVTAQTADLRVVKWVQCGGAEGCEYTVQDLVSHARQDRGGIVLATIFVVNDPANAAAADVTVIDELPPALQYVSSDIRRRTLGLPPVQAPEVQCSVPPVGETGTIRCTYPIHAPNTSYDLFFQLRIAPETPRGTSIVNSVTASSLSDLNEANNTSSANTLTVGPTGSPATVPAASNSGLACLLIALLAVALSTLRT
jgi:hypothetical protein